ncbi:unnamed protein product, partial [Amoebophrya sp. A25]|eukprot:GSA25T00018837001.1
MAAGSSELTREMHEALLALEEERKRIIEQYSAADTHTSRGISFQSQQKQRGTCEDGDATLARPSSSQNVTHNDDGEEGARRPPRGGRTRGPGSAASSSAFQQPSGFFSNEGEHINFHEGPTNMQGHQHHQQALFRSTEGGRMADLDNMSMLPAMGAPGGGNKADNMDHIYRDDWSTSDEGEDPQLEGFSLEDFGQWPVFPPPPRFPRDEPPTDAQSNLVPGAAAVPSTSTSTSRAGGGTRSAGSWASTGLTRALNTTQQRPLLSTRTSTRRTDYTDAEISALLAKAKRRQMKIGQK